MPLDEELRLQYGILIHDIRDFKKQQWLVTSYTVSIHVLLAGALKLFLNSRPLSTTATTFFLVVAWFSFVSGMLLLWKHHCMAYEARKRLIELQGQVLEKNDDYFEKKNPKGYSEISFDSRTPILLNCFMLIAVILITWITLSSYCSGIAIHRMLF